MRTATITETKNHLSALIHAVRRGESIIVMDRKKPVARIESVSPASVEGPDGRLNRLQREGVLLSARGGRVDGVLKSPPPRPRKPVSAVRALCSERAEGR
jgi:prevent-host-death family protein